MTVFKKLLPIVALSCVVLLVVFVGVSYAQTSPLVRSEEYATGINLENILTYTPMQHAIVGNVLTLGYAARAAGLVYFLATLNNIAPRFRLSSVLSAVVMSSAFLELLQLSLDWRAAFSFSDGLWQPTNDAFSNGFRYMNWSIDVPMLLLQLVVVLGLTRARSISYGTKFIIGGLLMIWTGYIGQFYEVTNLPLFYLWGIISTIFYVYVLFVIGQMINRSAD